jgi:amino acid transporter
MGAPIWVLVLILLAGIFGPWGLSLPMVFTNSRCAFAWGFDRIYPSKFADISRKHGGPTLAIWYNVAVSAVITYLYVFFPAQFGAMTYTMMLWAAGEIIVAFAGIVFPFKRKDIFDAAPSLVRMKIGAIPLMSIVAAICLGLLLFIEYAIVTPLFEGLVDYTGAVGITVIFVGTPTIIYYVSRWYQRRKGVPIDLAHRALPPE